MTANGLTFINFKVYNDKYTGGKYVIADCVELNRQAYACVEDGNPIEVAKERFKRMKPPSSNIAWAFE